MDPNAAPPRGVVAVILERGRFLVIRRSAHVAAPGMLCFPGGGVEPGESLTEALRRELREELALEVTPGELLWECTTPGGVRLSWWRTHLQLPATPLPDPAEVASWHWMTAAEIRAQPAVLETNLRFLENWLSGSAPSRV